MNTIQKDPRKKERPTIGFITEHSLSEYQSRMMIGVFEAAEKHDVNVIRFAARYLHNITNYETNKFYEVIQLLDLDGLLFLGWMRGIAWENIQAFKARFSNLPLFSLGKYYDDIPNVFMDGGIYVRDLLIHLIKAHGYKKIAYVQPALPDIRDDAYKEIMEEYGFFNPDFIINREELFELRFDQRFRKIAQILLDDRQLIPDAIMTMYHEDARLLIPELNQRGLRVPEDIAITSYEDSESARYCLPSLTTIYYPWREIGFHGCEKLIELIKTGKPYISATVPGKMVIRNSCGCVPNCVNLAKAGEISAAGHSLDEFSREEQLQINEEMNKAFPDLENQSIDINRLLEAFIKDYHQKTSSFFLNELQDQLTKSILNYRLVDGYDEVIYYFRKLMLPYLINQNTDLAWGEDIFSQAQAVLKGNIITGFGRHELQIKYQTHELQEIGKELITTFDIAKLINLLEHNLQKVRIQSSSIFLFNEDKNFNNCRLIFDYADNQRTRIDSGIVSAPEYLKDKIHSRNRCTRLLGQLLNVKEEFVGFVVFEPGPMDERIYSLLATELSAALRGAIILNNLAATKEELIESAHKAGMADFATGTLHNIGNVLNSINTSVYLLRDLLENSPIDDFVKACDLLQMNMEKIEDFICNDPKGKKLLQLYLKLKDTLQGLKEQSLYQVKRLDEKTTLIGDIISEQQSYAGAKTITEELDLAEILDDAVKIQSASLEKARIEVIKNYHAVVKTPVQKTKLMQIFINLFNNAKDALADTPDGEKKIILSIDGDQTTAYVQVYDSGCGVPAESLKTMFNLGFTTKKYGHGFGLHSCANFMGEMGGKIWAESEGPGKGTTFVLQFEPPKK